MKRSELKDIIRESVQEVLKEFAPLGVAETRLDERTPPNFPKALHDKLLKQYKGEEEKAYATMWKLFYAKDKGHKKVDEMWTAYESKSLNEATDSQSADHDETDLTNPEEAKEVDIARQIHDLVKKFLSIHGVGEEQEAEKGEEGEEEKAEDSVNEEDGEEDLSNPEEKEEVDIARQIKSLADELLAMHGVSDEEGEQEAGEEAAEEETEEPEQLDEKWGVKDAVHPSRKGMFKGKTKADLEKQLSNLKKRGPHKRGSKEDTKMKELNFAIRAKSGWPKKAKK